MIQKIFLDVLLCRNDVMERRDISNVTYLSRLGKDGVVC